MARDGIKYVAWSGITGIIISIAGVLLNNNILLLCAALCALALLFFAFFFRDPERKIVTEKNAILSPGDGFVVAIEEEEESEFFQAKIRRISVFLTVFDVHINRYPCSGRIVFFKYLPGQFKAALKEEASTINEQTIIGIENGTRKVLFKQIAGLIARRIVCTAEVGKSVNQGERCGLIKFGSRVDVLVPLNTEVCIKLRQKVRGGISVLGRYTDEE